MSTTKALVFTAAALASVLAATGCDVTPEKIERWKHSQKGPPKLRYCVRDKKLKIAIRSLCAIALAEIGQTGALVEDLESLAPKDRRLITDTVLRELYEEMAGASPGATSAAQIAAKDALFVVAGVARREDRAKAYRAVVTWILGDWKARRGGEHAGAKILETVGKAAGPLVAAAIAKDVASAPELARILAKIGSPDDRDDAARALIAVARMQKTPAPALLEALGTVGGDEARAYLLELAAKKDRNVRRNALLALRACATPAVVPTVGAIAADTAAPGDVRDAAFEVLEHVPGKATLDALAPLLSDKNPLVRYRAVEAMIACCKVEGAARVLSALPPTLSYEKADVVDYIEKDIRDLGTAVLPVLRRALSARSWIARVIAVRILGDIGEQADLPALERLARDRTRLKGWGPGATLGAEARAAAERLKKRL